MCKKFFIILSALLAISFATASFAASPPAPEKNSISDGPGADRWNEGKPGKPDAKVQTTDTATYPANDGGFKNDAMSAPGADRWGQVNPGNDAKVHVSDGRALVTVPNPVQGSGNIAEPGNSKNLR